MIINKEKCVLKTEQLAFLGHVISKHGISPDKKLVNKILSILPPHDKKSLSSFIGLVNFYRRYIQNIAEYRPRRYRFLRPTFSPGPPFGARRRGPSLKP